MHHSSLQGLWSSVKVKEKGKAIISLEEDIEEKEPSPLAIQKDPVGPIANDFKKYKEYFLYKVNENFRSSWGSQIIPQTFRDTWKGTT